MWISCAFCGAELYRDRPPWNAVCPVCGGDDISHTTESVNEDVESLEIVAEESEVHVSDWISGGC